VVWILDFKKLTVITGITEIDGLVLSIYLFLVYYFCIDNNAIKAYKVYIFDFIGGN
jgi:hypothetical protein